MNGRCNNLQNPRWGSMAICYERLLPSIPKLFQVPTYTSGPSGSGTVTSNSELDKINWFGVDQTSCTCSTNQCVQKAPVKLPNARLVSTSFFPDCDVEDNLVTHMVTQFGQFLDHDLVLTPEEEEHGCCNSFAIARPSCFPIQIPPGDYFYQSAHFISLGIQQTCLDHSRSTGCCSDSFESEDHEQFNGITAFVDASNVYGSQDRDAIGLRKKDGTGKLKVDVNNLLPIIGRLGRTAGDVRAKEMPGLTAIHTIFVREHNRLCDELRSHTHVTNSKYRWTDEDFFQNARRILIAEMQKIVYNDYLTIVEGGTSFSLSFNSNYDNTVNPSHVNSFGTAAYRFGHSMIQGLISMFHTQTLTGISQYPLSSNYFNMANYNSASGQGMEQIIAGLFMQKAQANDRHVTKEATNKLFANQGTPYQIGGDLVARNIQRGRDHGLPSYVAFYKALNSPSPGVMDCWNNKPPEISQNNWNILKTIYNHPHHIDLFVGGLAESPHSDGLTGKTFSAIIAKTFKKLKDGDRFFFTHSGNMNLNEYNQIMARTLGDIICDNTDIWKVRKNVFIAGSPLKNCADRNRLDINKFQVFRASKQGSLPHKPVKPRPDQEIWGNIGKDQFHDFQ